MKNNLQGGKKDGSKFRIFIMISGVMKVLKHLSFTASKDLFYRCYFSASGLQSVVVDIGDGTFVHFWKPKTHIPSKESLVLIHGFGANAMWQYSQILRKFVHRFNVYVPDLIFFGKSYTTRPERTESFQAECLLKAMRSFGVSKMKLVGISYGGFVGYNMAIQSPEEVERLVLCCTGVCLEEKDLEKGLFPVANLDEAVSILLPQTPKNLRELMKFSLVHPPKGVPSIFLRDFINVMCKKHLQERRELIGALLKDRQLTNLPRITQPALIIWGDKDRIFPLELGHRLNRHVGENAKLVVVEDAGHAINLEKPKLFAKLIKSFLLPSDADSIG